MKVLRKTLGCVLAFTVLIWGHFLSAGIADAAELSDFAIDYPNTESIPIMLQGSTHEMTLSPEGHTLWVTGQNYDQLVAIALDGHGLTRDMTFYPMPHHSGPHGIEFDQDGYLWVALEFAGEVVRLNPKHPDYATADKYDVKLACTTCVDEIDTHPHGLAIARDGRTVWYTGKATGTLGRITPDGTVESFPISQPNDPTATVGGVPIYIHPGLNNEMWFTELVGNKVGYIVPGEKAHEFKIETPDSRPISILLGPDGNMWFTEEAGNKVGRINSAGDLAEFPVPKPQNDMILAALAFDEDDNLWVQQYVDQNTPFPSGTDYLVKLDKSILAASPSDIGNIPVEFYAVPTTGTVMHRIIQGPNDTLWFTELKTDRVGQVIR